MGVCCRDEVILIEMKFAGTGKNLETMQNQRDPLFDSVIEMQFRIVRASLIN